ncbi:MAG TPA: response regulator [Streptosporangiaceae bacterium]|nr:response regulator [Streptosporangiaceae bacterium]
MSGRQPLLVIEDDADVRDLIADRLRGIGYRVECAATGEEGVALARLETPSLIILDILLPGIDGWEALREIRTASPSRSVSAIVVSIVDANHPPAVVDAYIVKPFRSSQIVDKVAELIGPPQSEVMT